MNNMQTIRDLMLLHPGSTRYWTDGEGRIAFYTQRRYHWYTYTDGRYQKSGTTDGSNGAQKKIL